MRKIEERSGQSWRKDKQAVTQTQVHRRCEEKKEEREHLLLALGGHLRKLNISHPGAKPIPT